MGCLLYALVADLKLTKDIGAKKLKKFLDSMHVV